MKFMPTSIHGAFVIELDGPSDDRGFFARVFCSREFRERGLNHRIAQANLCQSRRKGTLRGMHYQIPPSAESKLIRCLRGAIYDVIVDLRPESPSFLKHYAVKLTADNYRGFYIPPMCAHGYQTLTDNAEVFYQTGEFYSPEHERGLRYNDPALNLTWPLPIERISDKDANWPLLGDPVEPAVIARTSVASN